MARRSFGSGCYPAGNSVRSEWFIVSHEDLFASLSASFEVVHSYYPARALDWHNRRVRQAYSRGRTAQLQVHGASARVRLTHPTVTKKRGSPSMLWKSSRKGAKTQRRMA